MVTDSFYGGMPGQSFEIKKIFQSRGGLEADLNLGWRSEVGPGEFVVVSYGLPDNDATNDATEDYFDYKNADKNLYGRTFNGTLWQKKYDNNQTIIEDVLVERTSSNGGLYYELVTSMTGDTPVFTIDKEYIGANQDINVVQDISNGVDSPILKFSLPKSWKLKLTRTLVDADTAPSVVNESGTNSGTPIDTKTFQLRLPKPWKFTASVIPQNPDTPPSVESGDIVRGTSSDTQPFNFKLPKAWQFEIKNITKSSPETDPDVKFDADTSGGTKRFNFTLPKSQVIQLGTVESISPDREPEVELQPVTGSDNIKKLNFKLPKSQVIELGTVTDVAPNKKPTVTLKLKAGSDNIKVLDFEVPRSQVMVAPVSEVLPPNSLPGVNFSSTSTVDNPQLKISIPRGIKVFSGTALSETTHTNLIYRGSESGIAAPQVGDFYINPSAGLLFRITQKNSGNNYTAEYLAQLYRPLPEVNVYGIKPYGTGTSSDKAVLNKPIITVAQDGNNWELNAGLPTVPNIEPTGEFIGPERAGSVTRSYNSDLETVNFDFQIPRGARWFSGSTQKYLKPYTEVNSSDNIQVINGEYVYYLSDDYAYYYAADTQEELLQLLSKVYYGEIPNADIGDYFFDIEQGLVYKCIGSKIWELQDGTFKGAKSKVSMTKTYQNSENTLGITQTGEYDSTLTFTIPRGQNVVAKTADPLKPNQTPTVTTEITARGTGSNPDTRTFTFGIPKPWDIGLGTVTYQAPGSNPGVDMRERDNETKLLDFKLPRGIKVFKGTDITSKTATTFSYRGSESGIAAPQVGDLYINPNLGLLFSIVGKVENNYTVQFISELYRPVPTFTTTGITPYANGTSGDTVVFNTPTLETTSDGSNNWQIKAGLPVAPKIEVGAEFIGAGETGGSSRTYLDKETVQFNFQIPRGARLFSGAASDHFLSIVDDIILVNNGTEAPYYFYYDGTVGHYSDNYADIVEQVSHNGKAYKGEIAEAKIGDYFIDAAAGYLYICIEDNPQIWERQEGSLKGSSLSILTKYSYTEGETRLSNGSYATNSDNDLRQLVETSLGYTPDPDKIVVVDWNAADGSVITYWYNYSIASGWVRSVITGTSAYTKQEIDDNCTTKAFTATLKASEWSLRTEDWSPYKGKYIYNYSNTALKCGKDGDVPPLISCVSNSEEYSKIENAISDAGIGIQFVSATKPNSDIGIVVVDMK